MCQGFDSYVHDLIVALSIEIGIGCQIQHPENLSFHFIRDRQAFARLTGISAPDSENTLLLMASLLPFALTLPKR